MLYIRTHAVNVTTKSNLLFTAAIRHTMLFVSALELLNSNALDVPK